jgi:hypothetical protein
MCDCDPAQFSDDDDHETLHKRGGRLGRTPCGGALYADGGCTDCSFCDVDGSSGWTTQARPYYYDRGLRPQSGKFNYYTCHDCAVCRRWLSSIAARDDELAAYLDDDDATPDATRDRWAADAAAHLARAAALSAQRQDWLAHKARLAPALAALVGRGGKGDDDDAMEERPCPRACCRR